MTIFVSQLGPSFQGHRVFFYLHFCLDFYILDVDYFRLAKTLSFLCWRKPRKGTAGMEGLVNSGDYDLPFVAFPISLNLHVLTFAAAAANNQKQINKPLLTKSFQLIYNEQSVNGN